MSTAPLDQLTISESIWRLRGPVITLLVEALMAFWLALLAFHRARIADAGDA